MTESEQAERIRRGIAKRLEPYAEARELALRIGMDPATYAHPPEGCEWSDPEPT